MEGQESQRHLSAIMFSDIVGYSKMMGDDEQGTLVLLQEHNDLLVPIIERHRGSILKFIGDAILASFASAADAVHCAVEIQQALTARNKGKDRQILVRIGIHIGDVTRKGGDVFGDGVNIAARIQPLAEPGGICISQTVYHVVQAHPELRMVSLGRRQLKNIKEPMGIYEVASGELRPPRRPSWRRAAPAAAALALLAGGWLAYPLLRRRPPKFKPDEFGILVLPFHGLDAETERQGKALQSLVGQRLDILLRLQNDIHVISRWSPPAPANINGALALGKQTGAAAVLWGEMVSIGGRLQIQPYVSPVPGSGFSLGLASLSPPPLDADTSGRDSLEQLRAIAKTTADLALLVASYHFDKDGDRALALLGEIQPPTATSLTAQGSVFQSLKRLDEAQAAFQKAVALDGRFARAYDGLGAVMRARGRNAQALSYFEKSAELDPARAGPHTQLGLIHESEGRYEKALDEFKKAEALGPRTSVPRLHAGSLYDLLGRRREAEAELRALMEKIKNNPDEKLQVGPVYALILLRAGKAKDADAVLAGLAGPAWPASMSAFLAGKLGEEAFLRSAEAGDPQEKPRRLCQAYYFAGARLSLSGRPQDAARARGYFQKAVAAGKENVLEFQRARFELSRPK